MSGSHNYPQNPQEIHSNFEILFVKDNDTHVSDFMKQSVGSQFESGRVFYEFSSIDRRFSLLHYLEVIIIDDSKVTIYLLVQVYNVYFVERISCFRIGLYSYLTSTPYYNNM